MYFFDAPFEGVGKTPILAWRKGRWVNFGSKWCDVILNDPKVQLYVFLLGRPVSVFRTCLEQDYVDNESVFFL